jgi:chemotaxis protein MotB
VTLRTGHADGARTLRASGDRWLFGYADVVTLLFACFAALYATQNAPPEVQAAPAPAIAAASIAPAAPVTPQDSASGKAIPVIAPPVKTIADGIGALLKSEDQVHIDLTSSEAGTVISLAESGSFAAGKADLTPAAERVIEKLADLLRSTTFNIRVEGHTDDLPIRTAKYTSNWELSTARASRVVVFFIEQGGLAPERLSAAGYGEFRPRVPNDTPSSRARNRRVDIVVLGAAAAQDAWQQADYGSVGVRPSDRR